MKTVLVQNNRIGGVHSTTDDYDLVVNNASSGAISYGLGNHSTSGYDTVTTIKTTNFIASLIFA
jgi:hypothetical protein